MTKPAARMTTSPLRSFEFECSDDRQLAALSSCSIERQIGTGRHTAAIKTADSVKRWIGGGSQGS